MPTRKVATVQICETNRKEGKHGYRVVIHDRGDKYRAYCSILGYFGSIRGAHTLIRVYSETNIDDRT